MEIRYATVNYWSQMAYNSGRQQNQKDKVNKNEMGN
jgi:hypothetical protein